MLSWLSAFPAAHPVPLPTDALPLCPARSYVIPAGDVAPALAEQYPLLVAAGLRTEALLAEFYPDGIEGQGGAELHLRGACPCWCRWVDDDLTPLLTELTLDGVHRLLLVLLDEVEARLCKAAAPSVTNTVRSGAH